MGCVNSKQIKSNEIHTKSKLSLIGDSCYVKVVDVYDGHTLVIVFRVRSKFYKRRCKIFGVYCVEDEKSKEYTKKLLLGKTVWASFEKEDKNKLLLAYIWFDKNGNESVDQIIIRSGVGRKPQYESNILTYH